jgi:dTDP-4-dehydrorhamnose reductase
MRVLVTGASGLIGSNLAAAAAQQSWEVLGTFRDTPVRISGARVAELDMADRRACVDTAIGFEPDVVVHAAASVELSRLEREPYLAQLNQLGTENTLAAARAVRARYVLVSSDWIFSGFRPAGQCWTEDDPANPANAYGRSKLASEQVVQGWSGDWLITRPANVYGVNLSRPLDEGDLPAHVWRRSSAALRWVAQLRDKRPLPAPADVRQSPTSGWDYAQRVCELIAQDCDGVYNTAGPDSVSRLDYLRLLARAFDCDPALVREGTVAAFLREDGEDPRLKLPSNTTLCDEKSSFVLGHSALDVQSGHRLMREQLQRVLTTQTKEIHR